MQEVLGHSEMLSPIGYAAEFEAPVEPKTELYPQLVDNEKYSALLRYPCKPFAMAFGRVVAPFQTYSSYLTAVPGHLLDLGSRVAAVFAGMATFLPAAIPGTILLIQKTNAASKIQEELLKELDRPKNEERDFDKVNALLKEANSLSVDATEVQYTFHWIREYCGEQIDFKFVGFGSFDHKHRPVKQLFLTAIFRNDQQAVGTFLKYTKGRNEIIKFEGSNPSFVVIMDSGVQKTLMEHAPQGKVRYTSAMPGEIPMTARQVTRRN